MISKRNIILFIASTSIFFEALDIAIMNLTMPLIQKDFNVSTDVVQWLQTIYILPYGGFLIIGGKLSDSLGRKKIFIIGSALFLITSLGAGLSPSFGYLLTFRAIQGIAAALVMPSALSLVTTTFSESKERGRAIGIFSSFAAIGSGSGLSIGGILATYLGWQWVFFINVPVIIVTLCLAFFFIPNNSSVNKSMPDVISGILLTVIIIALSYVVHEFASNQANTVFIILLIFCILVGLWAFMKRNSTQKNPLIEFSLLRHSITGIGVFLLTGAVFTGYIFIISLILQKNLGFSAAKAGLFIFPFSILSALVGKFVIPPLLKKLSVLQGSIGGMTCMVLGALSLFEFLYNGNSLAWLLISIGFVNGLGIAICFTTLTVMSVQRVSEEHHGLASSVATTSYFFGGGLGLSVLSIFIDSEAGVQGAIGFIPIIIVGIYGVAGLTWLICHSMNKQH